jgi:hypothetical protein
MDLFENPVGSRTTLIYSYPYCTSLQYKRLSKESITIDRFLLYRDYGQGGWGGGGGGGIIKNKNSQTK